MLQWVNMRVRLVDSPPPQPVRVTQEQKSDVPKDNKKTNCPICDNKPVKFNDTTQQSRNNKAPETSNQSAKPIPAQAEKNTASQQVQQTKPKSSEASDDAHNLVSADNRPSSVGKLPVS